MPVSEHDLTWDSLSKTVNRGILPHDITVQMINMQELKTSTPRAPNEAMKYRVALWDGVTIYKNAVFSSASLGAIPRFSIIRIGTDTVPDGTECSRINQMVKGEKVDYAYIFFHYNLLTPGHSVGHRITMPTDDTQLMDQDISSIETSEQGNSVATPPPSSSLLNNKSTPPNSGPPPLRRPNGTSSMLARGSGGPSSSSATTPPTPSQRTSLSRESVKRNLADSFQSSAAAAGSGASAKRLNSGTQGDQPQTATHQVAALNVMMNRYVIKVRVSEKGNIRNISSPRWEGKVLDCKLSDQSGDIMMKAFNDHATDMDDKLVNGSTYLISGAKVTQVRDSRYNSTNHLYELSYGQYTKITGPLLNSAVTVNYKFIPISSIREKENDSIVDICGWVRQTGDLVEFRSRNGSELKKRELVLMDDSTGDNCVTLTLWETFAQQFDSHNRVITLKAAKVSEWNNTKTLNLGAWFKGSYEVEPESVPGVVDMIDWAATQAATQPLNNTRGTQEELTTIRDLKDELMAHKGEKRCRVFGWVTIIKHENTFYRACTPRDGKKCQKKVLEAENGRFSCVKCNKNNIAEEDTTIRFSIKMSVADNTDQTWCSMFNDEAGASLMGISAKQLYELKKTDEDRYQDHIASRAFQQLIFRVIAKIETYNDSPQLKLIVNEIIDPCWQQAGGQVSSQHQNQEADWKGLVRTLRDEIRDMENQLQVSYKHCLAGNSLPGWMDHL